MAAFPARAVALRSRRAAPACGASGWGADAWLGPLAAPPGSGVGDPALSPRRGVQPDAPVLQPLGFPPRRPAARTPLCGSSPAPSCAGPTRENRTATGPCVRRGQTMASTQTRRRRGKAGAPAPTGHGAGHGAGGGRAGEAGEARAAAGAAVGECCSVGEGRKLVRARRAGRRGEAEGRREGEGGKKEKRGRSPQRGRREGRRESRSATGVHPALQPPRTAALPT